MRLFAQPELTNEERTECLLYHDEQLRVAAFLDGQRGLLDSMFDLHWHAMTESPLAAGAVCRAADRFRQAAAEAVRRHAAIQSVPAAASRFHRAQGSYFSCISAWANANLVVMETLAQGRPPFYVRFERLKDEAAAARREANAAYGSFRRRLGLSANDVDALDTAVRTHDFRDAAIDDWQPEAYTHDFSETQNRILKPQEDGPQATVDTMMHNPALSTNPCTNGNLDAQDEASPLDRRDLAAWFNKGVSLAAAGRREEAITCYDHVLAIDPQDPVAWFNKGVNLAALVRREEAVECFDQTLALDPRDEMAWCAKGVNLAALGRREEAIACWDRALKIDTHCVAAWCAKGVNLAASDRHQEAVACFDEALKIDPGIAPVWSNKGSCLTALDRHDEAIVCCDKALELDPKDEAAWYNKAVSLAALARHEEAIACFDMALAADPRIAVAWSKKGNSLTVLHRPEEAITCYARAVRIEPRDAAAWYNKALREESCGRTADAVQSYQQFLEVAPPKYEDLAETAREKIVALGAPVARSS